MENYCSAMEGFDLAGGNRSPGQLLLLFLREECSLRNGTFRPSNNHRNVLGKGTLFNYKSSECTAPTELPAESNVPLHSLRGNVRFRYTVIKAFDGLKLFTVMAVNFPCYFTEFLLTHIKGTVPPIFFSS